jgi:uncharacterized membrane protein YphA (DoxX/SURF4 family)
MTPITLPSERWRTADALIVLARWLVGALFIYMGLSKALDPVGFLKLVRQYELLHAPLLLNLAASTLPWFEVFCGVLLVLGLAVRGTALMSVAMLVPFTVLVLIRALELSKASGQSLCALKFDCGCGGGEVWICGKLMENFLLTLLSIWLVCSRNSRLCLRHNLLWA